MELICTSLGCREESPVDYCKECSHANWVINKDLKFNPRFGFETEDVEYEIDWDKVEVWLSELKKADITKQNFVNWE